MRSILRRLALCLLLGSPAVAAALDPPQTPALQTPAASASGVPNVPADRAEAIVRRIPFPGLERETAVRITPVEDPVKLDFGRRQDEEVRKAVLRVRYTYSPMLTPLQSHVRVLLNGEIAGVLPVTRNNAGRQVEHEIALDVKRIRSYNQLSFEFIGHYTAQCEDPMHLGLWLDVLRGTEVHLESRHLPLPLDLALLPKPFFDPQDFYRLKLPFVFGARPSYQTLTAAGIAASWFGQLSGPRGVHFPIGLGSLPDADSIVFATNAERPTFLQDAPPFTEPRISVLAHPRHPSKRLLLISGRDGTDLGVAVTAMALGNAALSGSSIEIVKGDDEVPRKAYDAPNWVRLDRPMRFGELVQSPQQLQRFGHVPSAIAINLRIPPDLFTWRSRGVPVELKFRYTPPLRTADSRIQMRINDEPVQTVNLRSTGQGGESARVLLPLLDTGLLGPAREMLIPAFKLGIRNQLQYAFSFSYFTAGPCNDTQVENIRAMIDPDSVVDFTGYPHYAELPHLGYFASAGFPFTRYADLSQTAIVLPEQPGVHDIEMMLVLLARMGESTGYPATRVKVNGPGDVRALRDHDILLIGGAGQQPLLETWKRHLPAVISGPDRGIRPVASAWDAVFEFFGVTRKAPADTVQQKHVRGDAPLAALLGFESPLSPKRSVIALTGDEPAHMSGMLEVLRNDYEVKQMHGSIVLAHGGQVESLFAGKTYTTGSLPFWTSVWFPLSDRPILLVLMSVVTVLVFAFALWRTLRAIARRRLRVEDNR